MSHLIIQSNIVLNSWTYGEKVTCLKTQSNIYLNGEELEFDSYNIGGNNYFQLRELASVTKDTSKKFDVAWDGQNEGVTIVKGKSYSGEDQGKNLNVGKTTCQESKSSVYMEGRKLNLKAYLINGNNYFKLRDLAKEIDMEVVWNPDLKAIELATEGGYEEVHSDLSTDVKHLDHSIEYIMGNEATASLDRNTEEEELEEAIILYINRERKKAGLKDLSFDSDLKRLTDIKNQDMIDNNYFEHKSPRYGRSYDMMDKEGIAYKCAGENLARGQKKSEDVVRDWMNSKGHRDNIMNEKYSSAAVTYGKNKEGQTYWTIMFRG